MTTVISADRKAAFSQRAAALGIRPEQIQQLCAIGGGGGDDVDNLTLGLRLRMLGTVFGFPPVVRCNADGLVAIGGDLSPARLLVAYSNGIFPWPQQDVPNLLWFSPNPRTVLIPRAIHIGKSAARSVRKEQLEISFDIAFNDVINSCATMTRKGGGGTWITKRMISAYSQLHQMGFAHSVEAWRSGDLVGGVYGVSLGAAFFGESMFHTESNASKIALIALLQRLREWNFKFLDCQVPTPIANSLKASDWDAATFQVALKEALATPTRLDGWRSMAEVFELRNNQFKFNAP